MRRLGVVLAGAVGALLLPATAQASVSLAWSPQTGAGTFDFGTVEIGQAPGETFRLTNTGSTRTPLLRIRLAGSGTFTKTRDSCAGTRLAPGRSCLVGVRYTPTTDDQTDTTVMTANNKRLTATYAGITITGTAHGTADLEWTDTATGQPIASYDFGSSGGSHQFTLTNVGTATAYDDGESSGESPGPYLRPDAFCSSHFSFAPGAACTVTWTFDPTGCDSSGPVSGLDAAHYFTDSTETTHATARLDVHATCP